MENLNSVCYVARINEIKEIPGADNIEQGVIGGWNCIIKKGEYKVDDLVVVATTDAVIPQELSDEMNVTNYLRKGGRVRTVKLRGVYSECLIIPVKFLNGKITMGDFVLEEGLDVMDMLKIYKYEPPAKQIQLASGKIIKCKENEAFKVYYKFPNYKNVKGMFTEEDEVQITRKLHGTNSRYGIVKKVELSLYDRLRLFLNSKFGVGGDKWKWCEYEFYIGSHNVVKDIQSIGGSISKKTKKVHFYPTDVWSEIAEKYNIKEKLWELVKSNQPEDIGSGIVLYGEIYGAGIQKNYDYGLTDIEFAGFDCTVNGKYETPDGAKFIIEDRLDLPHVEVLYNGYWSQEVQDHYTFNNFIEGTKIPHEGIVIKYFTGERQKVAKYINPSYLIYSEKHDVGDSH